MSLLLALTGSGSTYTLLCDAGSYTLTGNDATLTFTDGRTDYALTCDAGSYAIQAGAATFVRTCGTADTYSGGYFTGPNIPRRTQEDIAKARAQVALEINREITPTKRQKKKIIAKAAQVVDTNQIEYYYRPDVADLTKLLMAELRVTVALPDYMRAIEMAIAAKQRRDEEDDDLEALLLLM